MLGVNGNISILYLNLNVWPVCRDILPGFFARSYICLGTCSIVDSSSVPSLYTLFCERLHRPVPRGNFDLLCVLSMLLTLLRTCQVLPGVIWIIPTNASVKLQFWEGWRGLQRVTSATAEQAKVRFNEYTCFQGSLADTIRAFSKVL